MYIKTQTIIKSQNNLEEKKKKNRAGGINLFDFRLCCKARVIKIV